MKKLFGTDGIRGEAGKFPLDKETAFVIGASLARQLTEKLGRAPRFISGRDTRESGAWLEESFCEGATSAGALCESAEVITTPGIAFLTKKFDFDAGIVISASHNPFHDNGIKVFTPTGKKLDEATEREIEKDIFQGAGFGIQDSGFRIQDSGFRIQDSGFRIQDSGFGIQDSGFGIRESGLNVDNSKAAEYQEVYLDYLAGEFKTLDLNGFKMVVDCANGAASSLAPQLFEKFGAKIVAVFNAPDGKNINADCGSLHLDNLQKKVLEEKADFGVAFDGDADRALFVDEEGTLVDGDAVLWIMANHLQDDGKLHNQTVVSTVMSNIGLEIALNSKNMKLLRTDVGDKYVLAELLNTESAVGGEQSGHIIFPHHSLVGDGMLTTLFLLEAVRAKNKTLSQMHEGFTQYPQILVNVKVGEKKPFESVPEIAETAARIKDELGEKGRLLLRYSGTENLARVMIEGENQNEIEDQANNLAKVIGNSLG